MDDRAVEKWLIPGPRHLAALRGLSNGGYIGIGSGPTFTGQSPAIPWRLMSGLADRGWVDVRRGSDTPRRKQVTWIATITDAGRKALQTGG